MRVGYVIVFVSDMQRSVAFYRDVVGLPLRFETPGWTEFATEGATWALHLSEAPPKAPDAQTAEVAGWCRSGFSVPDLDAFHQRMVAHNVPCVEAPKEIFGARVAQYADPDGMPFSVGQQRGG